MQVLDKCWLACTVMGFIQAIRFKTQNVLVDVYKCSYFKGAIIISRKGWAAKIKGVWQKSWTLGLIFLMEVGGDRNQATSDLGGGGNWKKKSWD